MITGKIGKEQTLRIVSHSKCGGDFYCYMLNKARVWCGYVNFLFVFLVNFCQPSSHTFSISSSTVTEVLEKNREFSHRYFLCTVPRCLVWISDNTKLFLFILSFFLKPAVILVALVSFQENMCCLLEMCWGGFCCTRWN